MHERAGYAVIGSELIRVLRGFVCTRYARFHEFVHRPSTVLAIDHGIVMSFGGATEFGRSNSPRSLSVTVMLPAVHWLQA
jgi:cytochrome b